MSDSRQLIRVGHSPDPDDAFMFYALAGEKIDTGKYRFEHELVDIETLNRRAFAGELELTAVSLHAYAHLTDRYLLCNCGASMGEQYGPMVVARPRYRRQRWPIWTGCWIGWQPAMFLPRSSNGCAPGEIFWRNNHRGRRPKIWQPQFLSPPGLRLVVKRTSVATRQTSSGSWPKLILVIVGERMRSFADGSGLSTT